MKKRMVAATMTQEQWERLTQTAQQVQTMQAEVSELQDAVVELADIVAGGETNG